MSWNYHHSQQKYPQGIAGTSGGEGATGDNMHDMHLKMSKKIAQLTKVYTICTNIFI